jgi:hypothetical protein
MKHYTDMTDEELNALTDEQINRLIDIEIATEGIFPVDAPIVPSLENEGIVQSEVGYQVDGTVFVSEEDAKKVTLMPRMKEAYDYTIGYNYKWYEVVVGGEIAKRTAYKQNDILRIGKSIQDNERKRNEFNKAKSAYDKFMSLTGKIRDAVWSRMGAAREAIAEIEKARMMLKYYTDLADGDEAVASKFFCNTYKSRPDIIEKVTGIKPASEIIPQPVPVAVPAVKDLDIF